MRLRHIVFVLLAFAASSHAAATIVTYGFQGAFYESNISNLAVGTPFAGTFSYDTNAPVLTSGPNFIDYHTGTLQLTIGGSSLLTTGIVDLELVNNIGVGLPTGFFPNRDLLQFSDFVGIAVTGPLAADHFITVLFDIVYPLNTLGNLALPTSVPPRFDASYIAIFDDGMGVVRGSFSSVPEPATIALIGLGLLVMRTYRRTLFRVTSRVDQLIDGQFEKYRPPPA